MEIRVPHQIIYQTSEPVAVADAIEALLGTERVLLDIGSVLQGFFPELEVNTRVYVQEIAEGTSLREVVLVAIFMAFQGDLEKEVPPLVDSLLGTHLSGKYNTVVTVLFLLLTFYGADFVFQRVNKMFAHSRIREQLDGLVTEVAKEFKTTEDKVRDVLSQRYNNSTRRKLLAKGAIRIFTPSKRQNNSALTIGDKRIEPILVSEIPSDAQILDAEETDTHAPVENVKIELHAQDLDRAKAGWAGVIPELSQRRLRMELYPPIKPDDLYTKTSVRGDIILVSKRNRSGRIEPYMFHLVRTHDD